VHRRAKGLRLHLCVARDRVQADRAGGDAKHMARDVEEVLKTILAKAKDGSKETGEAECASSVGNARS